MRRTDGDSQRSQRNSSDNVVQRPSIPNPGLFYIIVTKTGALTPPDIGVLYILSFLTSAFSLLTTLALPTGLTKFASENLGKNQLDSAASIQKTITKTVLLLSVAGFGITALFSQTVSQYFWGNITYAPLIILMAAYAFLSNIITLYNSSLQAPSIFGKMATVTLVFIVSSRIISIALALLHLSVAGVLTGYIVGSIIAVTLAVTFVRGKIPDPDNSSTSELYLTSASPFY